MRKLYKYSEFLKESETHELDTDDIKDFFQTIFDDFPEFEFEIQVYNRWWKIKSTFIADILFKELKTKRHQFEKEIDEIKSRLSDFPSTLTNCIENKLKWEIDRDDSGGHIIIIIYK